MSHERINIVVKEMGNATFLVMGRYWINTEEIMKIDTQAGVSGNDVQIFLYSDEPLTL